MMAEVPTKLVASHPTVRSDYHLEEIVEAGIALTGTEIKSLRAAAPNLKDAFVEVQATKRATKSTKKGAGKATSLEAWIVNLHIAPYSHGNIWNHEPRRRRKLLLHTHQLNRMYGAIIQDGMTIVPTRMYLKGGICKVEIALAKGKKKHDRREDMKRRSAEREISIATKRDRR